MLLRCYDAIIASYRHWDGIVTEEWRTVPGYQRYEVSSRGRVRSTGVGGNGKPGQLLKASRATPGLNYTHVALYVNGKRRYFTVHFLVMATFVGPRPDGMEINHIDGDAANNRRENLEYVTRSENLKHAYRIGRMSTNGVRNPAAKLTQSQVEEIRQRRRSGEKGVRLAEEFGVVPSTISFIVTGGTWRQSA